MDAQEIDEVGDCEGNLQMDVFLDEFILELNDKTVLPIEVKNVAAYIGGYLLRKVDFTYLAHAMTVFHYF